MSSPQQSLTIPATNSYRPGQSVRQSQATSAQADRKISDCFPYLQKARHAQGNFHIPHKASCCMTAMPPNLFIACDDVWWRNIKNSSCGFTCVVHGSDVLLSASLYAVALNMGFAPWTHQKGDFRYHLTSQLSRSSSMPQNMPKSVAWQHTLVHDIMQLL